MEAKTLLSKPNMLRMLSLYRSTLKVNARLPFYLRQICDEAVQHDFRNSRRYHSNTEFTQFTDK